MMLQESSTIRSDSSLKLFVSLAIRSLAKSATYAAGMIVLLVVTFVALRISPSIGLHQLWSGAVGSAKYGHLYAMSATLVEMAPLLLCSLSVCIAWRAGMFSIGATGQMLMGGLYCTVLAHYCHFLPAPIVTLAMIAFGVMGGAIWGFAAGFLRVRYGVQEVISTIMLNFVAIYVVSWLVLGPMRAHGNYLTETDTLPNTVMFARLIPPAWSDQIQTSLHVGVLLTLFVVPAMSLFLFRTKIGFNLRVVGSNTEAARVARMPVKRIQLIAMALSGGIAGLAGAIQLLGSATGSLPAQGFVGNTGFTAIPAALLGGLHPIGSLVSSLFFGALTQGCRNLEQNTGISSVVIYVIQAVAVLAVVGIRLIRQNMGESQT